MRKIMFAGVAASLLAACALNSPQAAAKQEGETSDKAASRLGDLVLKDGVPDAATAQKLYDELDYIRAVDAFLNGFPAVSQFALRKGFIDAGVSDNDILVCSGLMDAKSVFLTANADTYYLWAYLDLSKGPIVVETPPNTLGLFNDMWWKWVCDFGFPGGDRGEGGKYLILPPGYKGSLPEGGYFVHRCKTLQVNLLGRAFLQDNDPKPVDVNVKKSLKVYPYVPGGAGSSIGAFLNGKGAMGPVSTPASPRFVEGTGKVMNTIPPMDVTYFDMLNEVIQTQPVESMDPEILGQCAAIGIVKGKPFAPDARMKKILAQAVIVADAASRSILSRPRASEGFSYYGGESRWSNSLFTGGYEFLTPPPELTKDGLQAHPSDGARKLNSRTWFYYLATGTTPAMCMKMPKVGSQYLANYLDREGTPFDGAKTYKVTLPADIPAERFWSFTVYDNRTRSMLDTPQRYPRAGSQTYPSPAAKPAADGTTTVYFGPTQPDGVDRGNWIQTMPGKGWFTILRLYSPLQPFFSKEWRAGEIELVK